MNFSEEQIALLEQIQARFEMVDQRLDRMISSFTRIDSILGSMVTTSDRFSEIGKKHVPEAIVTEPETQRKRDLPARMSDEPIGCKSLRFPYVSPLRNSIEQLVVVPPDEASYDPWVLKAPIARRVKRIFVEARHHKARKRKSRRKHHIFVSDSGNRNKLHNSLGRKSFNDLSMMEKTLVVERAVMEWINSDRVKRKGNVYAENDDKVIMENERERTGHNLMLMAGRELEQGALYAEHDRWRHRIRDCDHYRRKIDGKFKGSRSLDQQYFTVQNHANQGLEEDVYSDNGRDVRGTSSNQAWKKNSDLVIEVEGDETMLLKELSQNNNVARERVQELLFKEHDRWKNHKEKYDGDFRQNMDLGFEGKMRAWISCYEEHLLRHNILESEWSHHAYQSLQGPTGEWIKELWERKLSRSWIEFKSMIQLESKEDELKPKTKGNDMLLFHDTSQLGVFGDSRELEDQKQQAVHQGFWYQKAVQARMVCKKLNFAASEERLSEIIYVVRDLMLYTHHGDLMKMINQNPCQIKGNESGGVADDVTQLVEHVRASLQGWYLKTGFTGIAKWFEDQALLLEHNENDGNVKRDMISKGLKDVEGTKGGKMAEFSVHKKLWKENNRTRRKFHWEEEGKIKWSRIHSFDIYISHEACVLVGCYFENKWRLLGMSNSSHEEVILDKTRARFTLSKGNNSCGIMLLVDKGQEVPFGISEEVMKGGIHCSGSCVKMRDKIKENGRLSGVFSCEVKSIFQRHVLIVGKCSKFKEEEEHEFVRAVSDRNNFKLAHIFLGDQAEYMGLNISALVLAASLMKGNDKLRRIDENSNRLWGSMNVSKTKEDGSEEIGKMWENNEAEKAHRGQMRASGDPYLQHCVETAMSLADIGANSTVVVAGLLHDTLDDSFMSDDYIGRNFGAGVADLVEGVSKLSQLSKLARENNTACKAVEADRLHTMFLAMADARAVLIKLADRLHNMETLYALSRVKQQRFAKETMLDKSWVFVEAGILRSFEQFDHPVLVGIMETMAQGVRMLDTWVEIEMININLQNKQEEVLVNSKKRNTEETSTLAQVCKSLKLDGAKLFFVFSNQQLALEQDKEIKEFLESITKIQEQFQRGDKFLCGAISGELAKAELGTQVKTSTILKSRVEFHPP